MQQGASDSTVRSLSRMEGPFADFHLAINYGIAECFLFKTSITRKLTGSRAPAVWPGNMISVLCNNNHRDASPFSQFYVFCLGPGRQPPDLGLGWVWKVPTILHPDRCGGFPILSVAVFLASRRESITPVLMF